MAKEKIKEYKQLGFTASAWGRELLLRSLGEEEANRVFPQMEGKKISEKNQTLTTEIEEVALQIINDRGFTTENEILCLLVNENGQKSVYQKQIKRSVPDMLCKYGLKRQRLNKVLKEQLGIEDTMGYPIILYKD